MGGGGGGVVDFQSLTSGHIGAGLSMFDNEPGEESEEEEEEEDAGVRARGGR